MEKEETKNEEMSYEGILNGQQFGFDTIEEFCRKHDMSQKSAVEYLRKYHPEWLKPWARRGD